MAYSYFINKYLQISKENCFNFLYYYLNPTNLPESEVREIVNKSIKGKIDISDNWKDTFFNCCGAIRKTSDRAFDIILLSPRTVTPFI